MNITGGILLGGVIIFTYALAYRIVNMIETIKLKKIELEHFVPNYELIDELENGYKKKEDEK